MPESLPNAQQGALACQHSRNYDSGIRFVPVAGPPGTPRVPVRLCAPFEDHIYTWTISSEGEPPICPSPGDEIFAGVFQLNDNLTLIQHKMTGIVTIPLSDGGHRWSMAGFTIYSARIPEGPKSALSLGHQPWETNGPADNSFPASAFSSTIIDKTNNASGSIPPLQSPLQG